MKPLRAPDAAKGAVGRSLRAMLAAGLGALAIPLPALAAARERAALIRGDGAGGPLAALSALLRRDGRAEPAGAGGQGPRSQREGGYAALIAEATSELIALLDERGRYRYVSASHTRGLGYRAQELVGAACRDYLHPDDVGQAHQRWLEAREHGSARLACRVAHRDGGWRWVDVRLDQISHDGERLTLLVARDVTDDQEREARLHQAQRALLVGIMASSIAHDLNNALAVIEGSVSLAADTIPADNPAHEDLAAISQASRHGSDLTRRLLAFVRRQPSALRPVDLADLVRETLPLVQRLVGRAISVEIEAAPALWPVSADRGQLEQVLVNLAANARDAMPQGGRLTLRLRNEVAPGATDRVRLEVSDTGQGLSDEALRRAFEPFYTTKEPGKGTGLGLYTCRCIVEQLGGTMTLGNLPGGGAQFSVLLPRHEGQG